MTKTKLTFSEIREKRSMADCNIRYFPQQVPLCTTGVHTTNKQMSAFRDILGFFGYEIQNLQKYRLN